MKSSERDYVGLWSDSRVRSHTVSRLPGGCRGPVFFSRPPGLYLKIPSVPPFLRGDFGPELGRIFIVSCDDRSWRFAGRRRAKLALHDVGQ